MEKHRLRGRSAEHETMRKKLLLIAVSLCQAVASLAQATSETVNVETPGTLSGLVVDLESTRIKSLTVTGRINGADILYLTSGTGKMAGVETLDLSKVTLVASEEPYASVVVARSDVGMGKTTAVYHIADSYTINTVEEPTGLGGTNITHYIGTNDLSGAFYKARGSAATSLKEVALPESLPRVGDYIFTSNTGITSVTVPAGVEEIGKEAFSETSITEIDIPSSVKRIGSGAFCATGLTGEYDFSGIESIGAAAFSGVKLTGTLNLGKLKEIPDYAFYSGDYDRVIFSESLESVGDYAFAQSKLSDVRLPESLKSVSASSFSGTPWFALLAGEDGIIYINDIAVAPTGDLKVIDGAISIKEGTRVLASGPWMNTSVGGDWLKDIVTNVKLPSSLKSIGDDVFREFGNLGDIELPAGLEYIGTRAFYGCGKLWFDNLAASMEVIGEDAFRYCSSLTQITLGENIKSVGQNAFDGCDGVSLLKIYAPDLKGSDNIGFGGEGLGKLVVGSKVSYLPSGICYDAKNLRKVEFEQRDGKTPLSVGNSCFYGCATAEFVNFPQLLDSIATSAFSGCEKLPELTFDGCRHIGYCAFQSCPSITSLSLPESLLTLGAGAFGDCQNLTTVEYNCINPEITGGNQWIGDPFDGDEAVSEVTIGKNVERLSDGLFGLPGLKKVVFKANEVEDDNEIPSSFEIGMHCFSGTELTEIQLPRNTTKIEMYAFAGCKFRELVIPAAVSFIGKYVFDESWVKDITILADEVPVAEGPFWYSERQSQGVTFHVPARLIEEYRTADVWKVYSFVTIESFVECVELSESTITLTEGDTHGLTVTLLPADADDKSVKWTSSNDEVATVDGEGKVTAVSPGDAVITVSTLDGSELSASCNVKVVRRVIFVESVTLDVTESELKPGEILQLHATVTPADADNKDLAWQSSNTGVATVDSEGKVTAVSPGNAVITVSTLDGSGLSATCRIAVSDYPPVTAIDTVDDGEVVVRVSEGMIIISGTYDRMIVYNCAGVPVCDTLERYIRDLVPGYYIVSVAGKVFKVKL